MFGSLLLRGNWDKVVSKISKLTDKTSSQNPPIKLIWLAPSSPFWSRSGKIQECVSTVVEHSHNRKNNKFNFEFQLFLPLVSEADSAKKQWEAEFRNSKKFLYGCKEGFMDGAVEIVLAPRKFAVVVFHIVSPNSMIPIPLGYMTEERQLLDQIEETVSEYLSEPMGYDQTNNFGKLSPPNN